MTTESGYKEAKKVRPSRRKRSVVLFIAMSLDGYIAKPDDDLGFLTSVERAGEDYGYAHFMKRVDCVILGRRTYDKILEMGNGFSYQERKTYVMTRTAKPAVGTFTFYSGNLRDLVSRLKDEPGKNIFIDGGAQIIHELLAENLIDELTVSIIPILLGDGIQLFNRTRPEVPLKLARVKHFASGLVQLRYLTEKNDSFK